MNRRFKSLFEKYICKVRSAHQPLSSTLYKSKTVGLYGRRYDTKPVGGASCPAVMALKIATGFFTGHPKDQMVKISPALLQRLIDTICYTTQMYKVKLSGIFAKNIMLTRLAQETVLPRR